MYVEKKSEYQNNPVIKSKIEVLAGGATIAAADFDTTGFSELKAGAIVGEDSNGLFHALKTTKVYAAVASDATKVQVLKDKAHGIIVGDIIVDTGKTLKAVTVSAINTSNDDYDEITISAAMGALAKGDVIIIASAVADAGAGEYKVTPVGVTINPVDLTKDNQPVGVLLRGSVCEANMPQYVDATAKKLLPLILFQ